MTEKFDNYLKNILPQKILENNHEEFKNFQVSNCVVNQMESLDGFLSIIYKIDLELKNIISSSE